MATASFSRAIAAVRLRFSNSAGPVILALVLGGLGNALSSASFAKASLTLIPSTGCFRLSESKY